MAALGAALADRLATRGVTVLTGDRGADLVVRDGRVVARRHRPPARSTPTSWSCAVDPRRLPALAPYVAPHDAGDPAGRRATSGLEGDVPDLPHEVVLHGDPMLVVRTGGAGPAGGARLDGPRRAAGSPRTCCRPWPGTGVDVRAQVVTRVDRSPRDLVERWGGSPLGVLWQGRAHRARPARPDARRSRACTPPARTPTPGAGLPFVGLSAALVAEAVGPA